LNYVSTTADNEETRGIVMLVFMFISLFFAWGVSIPKLLKDLFKKKPEKVKVEKKTDESQKKKHKKIKESNRVVTIENRSSSNTKGTRFRTPRKSNKKHDLVKELK
jgi:predicted RND superfamily exporter protein